MSCTETRVVQTHLGGRAGCLDRETPAHIWQVERTKAQGANVIEAIVSHQPQVTDLRDEDDIALL